MSDIRLGNATFIFACMLGALVYAAETMTPNPVPRAAPVASEPASPAAPSKCALQTWPNITADCLRNAGDQRIGEARLVAAGRP